MTPQKIRENTGGTDLKRDQVTVRLRGRRAMPRTWVAIMRKRTGSYQKNKSPVYGRASCFFCSLVLFFWWCWSKFFLLSFFLGGFCTSLAKTLKKHNHRGPSSPGGTHLRVLFTGRGLCYGACPSPCHLYHLCHRLCPCCFCLVLFLGPPLVPRYPSGHQLVLLSLAAPRHACASRL